MARHKPTHRERLVATYERELQQHRDAQARVNRATFSLFEMSDASESAVLAGIGGATYFLDDLVKRTARLAVLRDTLGHFGGVAFDDDGEIANWRNTKLTR